MLQTGWTGTRLQFSKGKRKTSVSETKVSRMAWLPKMAPPAVARYRHDREKIEAKGIRSVRSRVTNLSPYLGKEVTLSEFRQALLQEVLRVSPGEEGRFTAQQESAIRTISDSRYGTWEWNFGRSPACTIEKSARFESVGKIIAYLSLDHSLICSVEFRGDYLSTRDPEELAFSLKGRKLEKESLDDALSGLQISSFFTGLTKEQFLSLLLT